jgi:hypothetical protein
MPKTKLHSIPNILAGERKYAFFLNPEMRRAKKIIKQMKDTIGIC